MTLDSKLSKAVYQGNGSTTVFPFAFKVWDTSQIAVTVTDAAGVSTDVTSNSTITLNSSGGSVTYPKTGAPLPSVAKLAITRNMPFTQGINLVSASRFDPQVLEDGLDQATAERQQILEQMARAVILSATSSESPEDVVASIYASRDAAAASASEASTQAAAAEASAQAASGKADESAASAAASAQSAANAYAASEGMAPRMDAVELVASSAKAVTDLATITPGAGKIPIADSNGSLVGWVPTGRRNRFHNGDFRIDQISAGNAVTPATSGYIVDNGWFGVTQASKLTAQRILGSVNLPCAASERLTVAAAYTVVAADYFVLQGNVEGLDFADLLWGTANAKPITISFQVYVSLAGTYSFCVKNAAGTYSYVFTAALLAGANSIIATIPGCTVGVWPTGSAKCLSLVFDLGSGATWRTGTTKSWVAGNFCGATGAGCLVSTLGAVYEVSNIQIEAGRVATPFEFLPYQAVLAWCQRYFQKSYDVDTPIGTANAPGCIMGRSPMVEWNGMHKFHVPMRGIPTVTIYSPVTGAAGYVRQFDGTAADKAAIVSYTNTMSCRVSSTFDTSGYIGGSHYVADARM